MGAGDGVEEAACLLWPFLVLKEVCGEGGLKVLNRI